MSTENDFPELSILGQTAAVQEAAGGEADETNSVRWRNRRNPKTFKPFPLDCLPDVTRQYIVEKSRSLKQNPAGLALFILAQAGAHLGPAVKLRLGNDWFTAPIIWGCYIGNSGVGKSHALSAEDRLIQEANERFGQEYDNARSKWLEAKKEAAKHKKSDNNDETFCLPEPIRRHVTVSDVTFEGLVKHMRGSKCRTLLQYDELVSFFATASRNNQPGESGKWLSLHNGGKIATARAGAMEYFIPRGYCSVIGGSTIEKLRTILLKDDRVTDGTLSRFIFAWPPKTPKFTIEDITEETIRKMSDVILSLIYYEPAEASTILELSSETRKLWNRWREDVFNQQDSVETDLESSLIAKSEDLLPRLAIILHCLEAAENQTDKTEYQPLGDNTFGEVRSALLIPSEVTADVWRRAETLARWFVNETFEVYRMLGFLKTDGQNETEQVLDAIKQNDGLTIQQISDKFSRFRSREDKERLRSILDNLVTAGKLKRRSDKASNNKQLIIYY